MFHVDVCIVGAGPAGAFLGYLLARSGIKTLLVERHPQLDREFRGEHLHSDVEKLLKRYQLFEKVKALGILPMQSVDFYYGRKRVMSITPEMFGNSHVGIHVPHKHLLGVLIDEAKQQECFELLLNTAVTGLLTENDKVIGVTAKHGAEDINIYSHVVVGADGRFSPVRRFAEISTTIRKHGYDVLWAKIPTPSGWKPTMRMVLVNNTQISLFASTGTFVQIGWQIEEGSFPTLRKQSFQPFIDHLKRAAPELIPSIDEHIRDWSDFTMLPVQSSVSDTWVKDGLVIMGDAAHTMSPTGGIGVNAAMQDSECLARILTDAIHKNDYSADMLKTFELARRPEVTRIQEGQIRQEKSFKKINSSNLLMHMFYWNMRVLDRMPWKAKVFSKMYTAQK
ncbi:FAD-dependent monooxygenase [Alicyclobacillus dauci]|uniref:FAD-dependent monooxygenase n=1 Tax=Alicyclobacillus dauci TaxID=1475485 RepID=A0ABY6Z9G6_9BACL|nr:FAD-dependent monooxygenase [Alicyclobacillus dauci]WAH39183.1 FAD-dependent monooxygenase [Alicyclobacillus dauci]